MGESAASRVSSKYQVVIPRSIRESCNIHKGQRVLFVASRGVIRLVPDTDITELRGFLPGLTSEGVREEEDRF